MNPADSLTAPGSSRAIASAAAACNRCRRGVEMAASRVCRTSSCLKVNGLSGPSELEMTIPQSLGLLDEREKFVNFDLADCG